MPQPRHQFATLNTRRENTWRPAQFKGEFGWEIMNFAPWARAKCKKKEYTSCVIQSFPGMEPLYKDFAEFQTGSKKRRSLSYRYRNSPKEYYKYGIPNYEYDVLIHPRGIKKRSERNYEHWDELVKGLDGLKIAFIGTEEDQEIEGITDLRGIDLQSLMNYMAGAKVTVGSSSGTIHLASACGCPQVVWSNMKVSKARYKRIWNPFDTQVQFIKGWQPNPTKIVSEIREVI